jgi:hypothetical protein
MANTQKALNAYRAGIMVTSTRETARVEYLKRCLIIATPVGQAVRSLDTRA